MELLGQKIDFLGDSITEGHGTSSMNLRFTELLSSEYGILTVNHGIGGTRIARQRTPSQYPDHDKDFISRVPELDSDADVIMVFGG
ncbi:MAG: SGNH/GDSL hydrolase family protein, partial [Clostridia bacterium]|nr:SGNH/GDSL hydrolase family protein [Clostridia bacterium]